MIRGKPLLGAALWLLTQASMASTGADWLSSQTNADGSYAGSADIATSFQSTAETLSSFVVLGATNQPGISAARQYLLADPYAGTELLARQIISKIHAGESATALVMTLKARQNRDGGFGELADHDSSILDTAMALEALAVSGGLTSTDTDFAADRNDNCRDRGDWFWGATAWASDHCRRRDHYRDCGNSSQRKR